MSTRGILFLLLLFLPACLPQERVPPPAATPTLPPNPAPWQVERRDAGIASHTTVTSFLADEAGWWAGSYDAAGLWHSTDRGASWQRVAEPMGATFDLARAAEARWAATTMGLWWNKGMGWERLTALPASEVLGLATDGDVVYAVLGQAGLWRVRGEDAEQLPLPPETVTTTGGALGVAARGRWLLLGTSGDGVWQSRDGGQQWEKLPFAPEGFAPELLISDAKHGWVRAREGLWRSRDAGASWERLQTPDPTALLVEDDLIVIGARRGQLLASRDGEQWERWGEGLNAQLPIIEIARDEQGNLLVGMQDGLWQRRDDGWHRFSNLGAVHVEALARLGNGTLLAGHRDGLYRSTDGGASWQHRPFRGGAAVLALASDPHNPNGAWAGTDGAGVWRTTDGGAHWIPLQTGRVTAEFVTALFPDPHEADHLFAQVAYDRFYEWRGDGRGWRARWAGVGTETQTFTLAFDTDEPTRLWAGAANGLLTMSPGGERWQRTAPALDGQTVLALLPGQKRLWIGATRGLYRLNNDQSLSPTSLSNLTISALASHPETGYLFAGSRFYGLYASPDGAQWQKVEPLGNRTVTALLADDAGMWVATDDGLWWVKPTPAFGGPSQEGNNDEIVVVTPLLGGAARSAGVGSPAIYAHLLNPSDRLFREAAERGFTGVVVVFPWREIEPTRDEWHWEQTDLWVDAARYYGLELVVRLDQSPGWAAGASAAEATLNPLPERWEDFARFAGQVASRYRGNVRGYVLWNEPNLALDWGGQRPDPAGYLALLRATAPALRAADPEALIAAGALAPTTRDDDIAMDDLRYLDALLAAGAAPYFDVLAVHPYPFGLPPEAAPEQNGGLTLRRLEQVRALLARQGLGNRPLWATEFGYSVESSFLGQGVTEAERSQYLHDALALFEREFPTVETVALWNLAEGLAPEDEKAGYNLLDSDFALPSVMSREKAGLPIAPRALAADVRVHLGDSELPPPWWPLYGGHRPSTLWRSGFYLRGVPEEPHHLLLEILQPNEFSNEIRLNGQRLHRAPLPVADFTTQWLTLRLPVAPAQLRVGWNELEVRAGHLLPDFQQKNYVWDDILLRHVRLGPQER